MPASGRMASPARRPAVGARRDGAGRPASAGSASAAARTRCGAVRVSRTSRSRADSQAMPDGRPGRGSAGRRATSFELQRLVPWARSPRSTSATLRPREAASSATPAPVMPPPTTRTSTTRPSASSPSSRRRRWAVSAEPDSRRCDIPRQNVTGGELPHRYGARNASIIRAQVLAVDALGLGGVQAPKQHIAAQRQLDRRSHPARVALADVPSRIASPEPGGEGVDHERLEGAVALGQVGEHELRVDVQDAEEQGVGGQQVGARDRPWPRSARGGRARRRRPRSSRRPARRTRASSAPAGRRRRRGSAGRRSCG